MAKALVLWSSADVLGVQAPVLLPSARVLLLHAHALLTKARRLLVEAIRLQMMACLLKRGIIQKAKKRFIRRPAGFASAIIRAIRGENRIASQQNKPVLMARNVEI